MSKLDHTLKSDVTARRLKLSRRQDADWFFKDDKARIVEKTLAAGAVASQIARRHRLTQQTVSTSRRQERPDADG
ncbi:MULTISPECIES: hypothetical protein [unclassified Bradyrhizobium]|uniref:hypothetical protein n=1 Tax=unclassified Bradyrhizobium TaxID=2631580 RepID=UPI001FFABD65|nr:MULTISPECIES: hypothetical protein [unclassified Bradyrhizobium]MCK1540104.1 hypothetical protein [Bradyrhizobium sp. 176]MCK1560706.1 hypothetical protein [Bradyrhizobium sp. 171]